MPTRPLMILAELAVINWLLLLAASLLRARAWTPAGLWVALGNRDQVAAPTGLAGRTDRTARNMLENLVLFGALTLAAAAAGIADPRIDLGARLFFWGRLLYIPLYMAGIPVLRTVAWGVAVAGLGLEFAALWQALPPGY